MARTDQIEKLCNKQLKKHNTMKRIFVTLTMVAAFALSASAQKAITNVKCNAAEVVQWWNNKKAPHSNEETKDEERDADGNFA